MYDWLSDSLNNSGTIVTASRRLARVLGEEFAAVQLEAGQKAWCSPSIFAWQDWLVTLSNSALDQEHLPTRINAHQSQLLWEQCLRKELDDTESGISNLVRLSRETWQGLADWRVSIREVARAAQNKDQRLFASVAGRYLSILERKHWIDDAGTGELILKLIVSRKISLPDRHTFVGFDRQRPIESAIRDAMINVGIDVAIAAETTRNSRCSLQAFESTAAELRSAGAWARRQLEQSPNSRVAIIANGLDQNTESISRYVREGATPGWQNGRNSLFNAVNVSYGRHLADYPAISVALTLLRWLVRDLSAVDVGLLLRSPILGAQSVGGRSRLDLRLRQLPDRSWSPAMVGAELRGQDDTEDVSVWLGHLAALSKNRRELPKKSSPAAWAELVDGVLRQFMWPGSTHLDSTEFQLISRWRELLNEFARLALVSDAMLPGAAITRLELMAGETLFQPESPNAMVQLLGPLEATGNQFDAVWISGMTTSNWPPASSPSALVSRRLQEAYGMPDCTPDDTYQFAEQVITGLVASGKSVVCSYPLTDDDVDQSVSDLLSNMVIHDEAPHPDPGWYAATLVENTQTPQDCDNVPLVVANEKISGGAATIQRQLNDPISAFIQGRLGARLIYPQAVGIPAPMRGSLIHEALFKLYVDLPTSASIGGWSGEDLTGRIESAVNYAFARHEKNTDAVLQHLFALERLRVSEILRKFVIVDSNRGDFRISGVEGDLEFISGPIRLPLRFDRIDSYSDGSIAILDYKTGTRKRLIDRSNEVQEIQLFVYACASKLAASALALVNLDSREVVFDGAGRDYSDLDAWPDLLEKANTQIAAACEGIARGDVRVNISQGMKSARPLNLLSRYTELRHNNG